MVWLSRYTFVGFILKSKFKIIGIYNVYNVYKVSINVGLILFYIFNKTIFRILVDNVLIYIYDININVY